MTAQAAIPQASPGKVQPKPASSPVPWQKAVLESRPSVYWGDRFTIRFWLVCFGLMAAMNLFEAVHQFARYLFGSSPPP
ncbi:MAG TPA: hypothetical protein VMF69_21755 [Gemmataceae bacterium]|nr:hypothetical protein [Gemmataceae bacterium]